jgi:hypothetical protein
MRYTRFLIILAALFATASMAAVGHCSGQGANPSNPVEINGTVVWFTGGFGSGMPTLTVSDPVLGEVDIALGPIWFLQESGFIAEVEDSVLVLAYECPTCSAGLVAAWVDNLTNGTFVDLRNEDGRPLWTQRQRLRGGSSRPGGGGGNGNGGGGSGGGSGNGGGSGGGNGGEGSGLDMSQVDTVTGEVVEFTGHAGSGQPVMTLDVEGEHYEITVSPYGPVAAAGLTIEPGLILTVTYAPTECQEDPHLVTISILDDATGFLIQLRDPETGFPMAGGNQHNRHNRP